MTGFLAGLVLGLVHWRMFLRNIQALQPAGLPRVRLTTGLTGGLRLALTATVGFWLIHGAGLSPYGVAAGLLVSGYGFRVWAWRQAQEGNNDR